MAQLADILQQERERDTAEQWGHHPPLQDGLVLFRLRMERMAHCRHYLQRRGAHADERPQTACRDARPDEG